MLPGLAEAGLDQFEALLDAPDQEVFAWLQGRGAGAGRLRHARFRQTESPLHAQEPHMERLSYIARTEGRLTVTGAPEGYDA